MATTAQSTGEVLRSERIAGGILPKTLNTFDLVAIFVGIVLFITNSPGIAAAGPVAYIYLVAGFLTFLIPGAIVTGQLGRMFPKEGSIYVWTNKAFGPFWGFFAGFCAWWPGIFVILVAGSLVSTFITDLFSRFGLSVLTEPWQLGLVIIAVTAISFGLSVVRFRAAQNLVNIVFIAYGVAIVLIGLAGVIWLLVGHAGYTNLALNGGGWGITFGGTGNFTIFGFVILALLGIEVPLNMGVEVTSERAITRYLVWGPIIVMVAYLLTIFGIMIAVPAAGQTNLWAMVDAVHNGFGPAGQVLAVTVDLIMIGWGLYAAVVYNYSFGRMLFVSGLDRRLPPVMSKVNAARVPWVAVLVQSIIIAALAVAIYMVIPYISGTNPADLANLMYYILFASTTVIWCISIIFLFYDVIVIRYKYHEAFAGARLAPDWVFYLASLLGLLASGVGLYVTVTAPWVPSLIDAKGWDLWIAAIVVLSLIAATTIYFLGRARIREDVTDEQTIAAAVGILAVAGVSSSRGGNLQSTVSIPRGSVSRRSGAASYQEDEPTVRYVNVCITRHSDQTVVPKAINLEGSRLYDLRINIGPFSYDSVVENTVSHPFPTELLPETEDGHWLEVIVVSDEFMISKRRHGLFLPRSGPSWVCDCPPGEGHRCNKNSRNPYLFIAITAPEQAGIARLRIAIYYEKNLIQSQLLAAQISGAEQKQVGYSSRIDYTLTADLHDVSFLPPRTLHILTNQNVDGTHRIIINGQSENFLAFNLTEEQMGDTVRATREALRNVHFIEHPTAWGSNLPPRRDNLLDRNNGKSKEKFIEDLKRLAPLGCELWDMLLKDEEDWWKTLQEPATIQVSRMMGSTFVFPWALVYDIPLATYGEYKPCPLVENWDGVHPLVDSSVRRCPHESEHGKKNTLCPFGFWGIKHIIEQPPSPKDRNLPLAVQVTHEPPELMAGLSLALDEDLTREHLQSLELTPFHMLKCSSLEEIVKALKGSVEVVYFYCHGGRTQLPGTKQGTPFLEVGVNERFQPNDITVWRRAEWPEKHWKETTPLVFLNGCHTAELTPELLVNFVDGFTAAHAAGVIGTEITLLQSFVSEAALQFFTHFQKNRNSVGQSLREMRLHFLVKGNLLGLAYTPYCSADLHL